MFLFVQRSSALLLSTATCIHASIYADAHYQVIEEARRPWLLTRETCAVSLFFPGKGEISNRRLSSCGRATVEVWIHIYTLWYDIMIFFSFLSHSSAAAFMADETERKSFCFIRVVHSERRPALFPFFISHSCQCPRLLTPTFFFIPFSVGTPPWNCIFFFVGSDATGRQKKDTMRNLCCCWWFPMYTRVSKKEMKESGWMDFMSVTFWWRHRVRSRSRSPPPAGVSFPPMTHIGFCFTLVEQIEKEVKEMLLYLGRYNEREREREEEEEEEKKELEQTHPMMTFSFRKEGWRFRI